MLRFLGSPAELLGADRVEGAVIGRNRLEGDADGRLRARPTGRHSTLRTGLVLRSIGYFGTPIPGLPFDETRGVIPHQDGRVLGAVGTYVVGWIKRGPSGIIGTNKKCARETVAALLADAKAGNLP